MASAPNPARTSRMALIRFVPSSERIRRTMVTTWGSAGSARASRLSMIPSLVTHRLFQISDRGE